MNSAHVARDGMAVAWQTSPLAEQQVDRRKKIAASLLLFSAVGPLYNNFALVRVNDLFVVDLSHLVFVITSLAVIIAVKQLEPRFVVLWLSLLCLELVHVLLYGLAWQTEWLKSFAQVGVYSWAFVMIAGLKLERKHLTQMGNVATLLAVTFGGFGLLQFILLNAAKVNLNLPEELKATTYAVAFGDYRYEGIARALGISREPAEFSLGLVILIAFLVFLHINRLVDERKSTSGILLALGGILVSFSPTGFLAVLALFFVAWYVTASIGRSRSLWLLLAVFLALLGFWVVPLSDRLSVIAAGTDISSAVRLLAPLRVLFDISPDTEFLLFGTGLGLEERDIYTYLRIYQPFVPWQLQSIYMHNILAVIKFQQGVLGLFLYFTLLWAILRPIAQANTIAFKRFTPILVSLLLFFFSTGYYAAPFHWSVLAFVTVLASSRWYEDETVRISYGS